jgi:hypothetical protein
MPERRSDTNAFWTYEASWPGANYQVNPIAVRHDKLVEAAGVDGRFEGAIRPFPGMADESVHGVPNPEAGHTITTISNIIFAKYASVQKGISRHTLKGVVLLGDAQAGGGGGKALYFAYRDSSDGSTDVVQLEDFGSWTDFTLDTLYHYDVTCLGRYIYFVASGVTSSTVTLFDEREPPYNKAYYWDFIVNAWEGAAESGFQSRFLGCLPQRLLSGALNKDDSDLTYDSSEVLDVTEVDSVGFTLPQGYYTAGAEIVSRKHNIRSWLRYGTLFYAGTADKSMGVEAKKGGAMEIESQTGAGYQITIGGVSTNALLQTWGISHGDGLRVYQSPGDGSTASDAQHNEYSPVGQLYEIENYVENTKGSAASTIIDVQIIPDDVPLGAAYVRGRRFTDGVSSETVEHTGALQAQRPLNALTDLFGPAPRMKRIAAYAGLLVGVTDVAQPALAALVDWDNLDQRQEEICWSHIGLQEPENFPPENRYPLDDPSEKVLALELAGDHLFAITNASIYKITRSGGTVSVNRTVSGLGGTSRSGATGVGSTLFIVTTSGAKSVDGNTGALTSISALDRIITDDSEWGQSLDAVSVEYDARAGALIFLNTTAKEAFILWEATGAVTRVADCPWTHLVAGTDVGSVGARRAYWVMSDGTTHCIDAHREMGKRSMCGIGAAEAASGAWDSGSSTVIVDSSVTMPVNCVGHKVYMLTGDLAGESAIISTRDSATQITHEGFTASPAVGDIFSISPVYTELVFQQLGGTSGAPGAPDPYNRKITTSMSMAFSNLGGETGSEDLAPLVWPGVWRGGSRLTETSVDFNVIPDKCVARVNAGDTRPYPSIRFFSGNIDFELQALLVRGVITGSEAQSRQS